MFNISASENNGSNKLVIKVYASGKPLQGGSPILH